MISQTEENYLKAIYKISEKNKKAVSTNAISEKMKTSAASVTDMIKRLATKELVNYEKYKGVTLSESGNKHATNLIRKHRLWEVFLVDQLKFNWEEVHDIAEQMEHINSEALVDRLDNYLGNPKFDPHGDPIPNAEGRYTLRSQIALSELSVGDGGTLIGVKIHDRPFLEHLNSLNIKLGTQLSIKNRNSYDGAVTVVLDDNAEQMLSNKVSVNLLLRKNNQ